MNESVFLVLFLAEVVLEDVEEVEEVEEAAEEVAEEEAAWVLFFALPSSSYTLVMEGSSSNRMFCVGLMAKSDNRVLERLLTMDLT
jgi:hypothetical protein